MRRLVLLAVILALFAGQASAAMWELDRTTALGITNADVAGADLVLGPLFVYDGPGAGFPVMSGMVGYAATLMDYDGDGWATATIWADTLVLSGTGYDGITSYLANDNQSVWSFQLFYTIGDDEFSSDFISLAAGNSTYLTALAPSGDSSLDLGEITTIGFRITGNMIGHGDSPYPSPTDTFHMSVVPVPGAVLLGVLGLGAAGMRLRKRQS